MADSTAAPTFLYDLPRLLWLREVEQQLQRRSEPALHVLGPGTTHPPPPSPSRGEGEVGCAARPTQWEGGMRPASPLPRTGREGEQPVSPLPRTGRGVGGEGALSSIAVLSG